MYRLLENATHSFFYITENPSFAFLFKGTLVASSTVYGLFAFDKSVHSLATRATFLNITHHKYQPRLTNDQEQPLDSRGPCETGGNMKIHLKPVTIAETPRH